MYPAASPLVQRHCEGWYDVAIAPCYEIAFSCLKPETTDSAAAACGSGGVRRRLGMTSAQAGQWRLVTTLTPTGEAAAGDGLDSGGGSGVVRLRRGHAWRRGARRSE
jgi:hypothetical protein